MLTKTEQSILNAMKEEYEEGRKDKEMSYTVNCYTQGIICGIKTCIHFLEANASEEFSKKLVEMTEMLYENLEEDMEEGDYND